KNPSAKDLSTAPGTPKSLLLSVHIKREGESPVISPLSSDDPHHSDRYQGQRSPLPISNCRFAQAVMCALL
ncbi:E3 ubiquitin-protein ligase RNF220a isoform X1, partial [Tachysurus ichikawai]